jgi:ketosteroid isomerase-like protein
MPTVVRRLVVHPLIPLTLVLISLTLSSCSSKDGSSKDIDAINTLHQRDMEASKKWDVDTLASLWTDDIVTLSEAEPAVIGKASNRESVIRLRDQSRDLQITDYVLSFNEVKIVDDWAFEWGTYSGAVKPVAGGEELRSTGKLIRVLKKESDGTWRIARAMFNSDIEPD